MLTTFTTIFQSCVSDSVEKTSSDKEKLRLLLIEAEVNAEIEKQKKRCRPESIKELVSTTKFSRGEIQQLYRGFKEDCPNGFVTKEKFLEIFEIFFPYGKNRIAVGVTFIGSANYANFVFGTFDDDGNGEISFDEFVKGLSVLSRGSQEEKLGWIFQLYDREGKGFVDRDDVLRIINSIYEIFGDTAQPPLTYGIAMEHADQVFQKMDVDGDGRISRDEFLQCCKCDENISHSMELFKTMYSTP